MIKKDSSQNSILSRILVMMGFAVVGTALIIAGSYSWPPLIIAGIVVIILGFFLSDLAWVW